MARIPSPVSTSAVTSFYLWQTSSFPIFPWIIYPPPVGRTSFRANNLPCCLCAKRKRPIDSHSHCYDPQVSFSFDSFSYETFMKLYTFMFLFAIGTMLVPHESFCQSRCWSLSKRTTRDAIVISVIPSYRRGNIRRKCVDFQTNRIQSVSIRRTFLLCQAR